MKIPAGYLKKKSHTIPFGYEACEFEGYIKPIPEQLEVLHKYLQGVTEQKYSLREAAKLISQETGRNISHVAVKNYIDSDPSLEEQHKKKIAQRKAKLAKQRKALYNKERKVKAQEQVIKKATEQSTSHPVDVQEQLRDAKVVFSANEGPQTDFLAADEKDVLYGGAAGGGKSYAMLVDPLRYAHKKAHRALILRRSMPELREMIDKSRELYPQAFPGAKFREVEKLWNFPSGAKIEFGFLERDADVYRYQGQAYSWIGFDEITHLPTEFSWNYLASRLRTTDPETPVVQVLIG
jgi:hypothetical protein